MCVETVTSPLSGRPLVFGEVLYDHFPDGSAVLGGAPFNVAWHLHGFGTQPVLVSRVGDDAEGEQVTATMMAWGMDLTGVQRDTTYPTGVVRVHLAQGQPAFDILAGQAYDHIDADATERVLDTLEPALLYHGTLALRSETTRTALIRLRAVLMGAATARGVHGVPGFVDINLRPPWWDIDLVSTALQGTRWAKLNEDELAMVTGRTLSREDLPVVAEDWRQHHGLALLVLTLGSEGAWLLGPGLAEFGEPVAVHHLADTVGAGDAFSAVTLLGLLRGWAPAQILPRALAFASRICAQHGATAPDLDLYREFLDGWEHADSTTA